MDKKQGILVNYIYFGFFFSLLLLLSTYDILFENNLEGMRFFFFLYSLGQIALETTILIFIGWALSQWIGMKTKTVFVGMIFLCLVIHVCDFFINRMLDSSVWETVPLFFTDSFKNILYLLDASGISIWIWLLFFLGIASLPLLGATLYHWSEKLTKKRPISIKPELFFQTFFALSLSLLFWELSASPILHPNAYTTFIKSLPWKSTFLQPTNLAIKINPSMMVPPSELNATKLIESSQTKLEAKPNIYLFVIESLREDFITKEIAPNLFRFKQEALSFPLALSNANCSHPSWFSILHSQFSHYWHILQNMDWSEGAPPLRLLKKWGYQIRLYSSAQLSYYGMEPLLFGKNQQLLDSYHKFPHPPPLASSSSDLQAMQTLEKEIQQDPALHQGQLMITFLDATHFSYSWPEDFPTHFQPISNQLGLLQFLSVHEEVEKLKNRYRNAICYLDSLLGQFLQKIPDPENAIIIITGDHAEEFFEQGHLFHGSKISHQQTHIPIYMKLGQRKIETLPSLVSQMDIFPTILHHLSNEAPTYFEGRSIFAENRWPYVLISRFNGGQSPYEVCLHNGSHKLILQFDNRSDILHSNSIRICSVLNKQDQCCFSCKNKVKKWVANEFHAGLLRLFPAFQTNEYEETKDPL